MTHDRNASGLFGKSLSRRRVLGIVAACGVPLVTGGSFVLISEIPNIYRWRGRALGAPAQITLAHPDAAKIRSVLERCITEIIRLEAVFSLYQGDSEISRLNRDGRLRDASLDLRILLAEALRLSRLTGGAFDVTVQPLWTLYAAHFAAVGPDGQGPSAHALETAQQYVDYRQIDISGGDVGFLRPGMGITLNGIAQGYITDRISEVLRDEGFDQVLADLGEIAALDPPTGQPGWTVRIADPGGGPQALDTLVLANRAIATSAGRVTRFDRAGRFHHLFDPRTGRSAAAYRSVSVIAKRAALADGLSTALSVLPHEDILPLLRAAGADRALLLDKAGSLLTVTA